MHFWVKLNQQRSFRLVYNPHQLVRYNPHSSAQHWTSHLRGVIQSSLPCLAAETKPTELSDELVACAPGHWLSYPQTSHGNGKSTIKCAFQWGSIWKYMNIYENIMYTLWLVVSTPLKNMKVSWGDKNSQYIEKKIMFQTTNQLVIGGIVHLPSLSSKGLFGKKTSQRRQQRKIKHPDWASCGALQFTSVYPTI